MLAEHGRSMETLIVFANQGKVRPVKLQEAGLDPQEKAHLHEIRDAAMQQETEAVSEVVTDSAGKFPSSGPIGHDVMAQGEQHNLETEMKARNLERVADQISRVVAREGNPLWRLVAPAEILPAIEGSLAPGARDRLSHTETADLTKVPIADLEQRYLNGA
jgi:hypothetical protein